MSAARDYAHAKAAGLFPYLELDENGAERCVVVEEGFEYIYTAPSTKEDHHACPNHRT